MTTKLNIGCGVNRINGFINADKYEAYSPDLLFDAEIFPWPFETSSIDEVMFNHSLEHMGASTNTFFSIIKELYRVCKPGAMIHINVPHPRHDNYINDPTHVRVVTPHTLSLFSQTRNNQWKESGAANSQLALMLQVDFELQPVGITLDKHYTKLVSEGYYSLEEISGLSKKYNNVISEYKMTLVTIKPGRNLE